MNNHSPLVPQGSFLDQKNKGRARVKIAVFFVLAVHGIGLMALLMLQGCNKPPEAAPPQAAEQAAPPDTPTFEPPSNPPAPAETSPAATAPAAAEAMPEAAPVTAPETMPVTVPQAAPVTAPETMPVTAPTPPTYAVAGATEYRIAKGDTFSSIAKKFHVSVRAITDANPGVQPTRLQIGQAIHIPAPTPSAAAETAADPLGTGEPVYSVKSGDTLTRIAHHYKVSIQALRSANNLQTDRIKVGQKLRIPVKASAPAAVYAPPVAPAQPAPPAPSPISEPMALPSGQ